MRKLTALALFGAVLLVHSAIAAPDDGALKTAIAGAMRTTSNVARDAARHPYDTLLFWGLKPKQTVIEIEPGGALYWSEILAPYSHATGGAYVATVPDLSSPEVSDDSRKQLAEAQAKFEAKFGKIGWAVWDEDTPYGLGPANSADMVITARNIHDWMWTPGSLEKVLDDCYMVLKPGGILAVEDHRADPRPQVQDAHDGYVTTAVLVKLVEKAGFKLEASSEVNANPKDTKDYPFGVWTLPPTNARTLLPFIRPWPGRAPDDTLKDAAAYQAIGESDRMTLRFRKPR